MLRRFSAPVARVAMAVTAPVAQFRFDSDAAPAAPTPAATAPPTGGSRGRGNFRPGMRRGFQGRGRGQYRGQYQQQQGFQPRAFQQQGRTVTPRQAAPAPPRVPRMEIPKAAAKKDDGGKLTATYVGDNVILNWSSQTRDVADIGKPRNDDDERKTPLFVPQAGASLFLTPMNTARAAGVFEGVMDKVEMHARSTKAVITRGDHGAQIACSSTLPNGKGIEWKMSFDAAETLMLHRFLIEAIHANHGFRA